MSYSLNIRKNRNTGEFEVTHNVDGEINENFTYYTDDEVDAAQTLMKEAQHLESQGIDFTIGSGAQKSLAKYMRVMNQRDRQKMIEKL